MARSRRHDGHLTRLTTETSPALRESFGVGANTAAERLILFGDTPPGFARKPPLRSSAAHVRSRPPPGGPLAGTVCIGAATVRPTPPSIEPSSSGCGSTSRPSTTSHARTTSVPRPAGPARPPRFPAAYADGMAGCYPRPARTRRKLLRPASRFSMISSARSSGSGRSSRSVRLLSLSQKMSRLVLSWALRSP